MLSVQISRETFVSASGARVEVLRDIAFTLDKGEVAAFVGPSGCGKTTMLRIIAGLEPRYEGAIAGVSPRAIGMVFQEPRLLPWRTVDQNLRLVAPRASPERLAALLEILELTPHRWQVPGELSLGLARRVALARAFVVEPELLILDEPFVSLDQALARRLRSELATLVEARPITTILVTHDLDDAIWLADRLFLLAGRPAQLATELRLPGRRGARERREIDLVREQVADLSPLGVAS